MEVQWDREFEDVEASLSRAHTSQNTIIQEREDVLAENSTHRQLEQDDLARTAGLLVDTIRGEQNPKFKNSQFLNLMRKLRDGDVVVNGEDLVERSSLPPETLSADAKGKGKARASGTHMRVVE